MFTDRRGEPITVQQWARLWEDLSYRVVAEDQAGSFTVMTVWEGLPPPGLRFATGVGRKDSGRQVFVTVASAEDETGALAAHRSAVAAWSWDRGHGAPG